MTEVSYIRGETYHGRKGPLANAFRYSVDYVMLEPDRAVGPRLFSRNRRNLMSMYDRDYGGVPGAGRSTDWVRQVLADHGLPEMARIELIAQARVFGHVFNPVSFWLCRDGLGRLRVVIAEVTNTYGDRHSYLVHREDVAPIGRDDELLAKKVFHVSPFQPVAGEYRFRFDIRPNKIGIWIDYTVEGGGIFTNLTGLRQPLTNRAILAAAFRRPFGSRRVLALIHWQALKLWVRGAVFRNRPKPPIQEVSQ